MLRVLVIAALVAVATAHKATFDNYKVYRIIPSSAEQLKVLQQLEDHSSGYSYWLSPSQVFRPVDLMVAPSQMGEFEGLMNATHMLYETFVPNVQKLIERENPKTRKLRFSFESYHTLTEIYDWLDELAANNPDKVETLVGGSTYEGREIRGVKLSFGSNKPGVFVEGGIHAREWISPATVLYLLNEFLTSSNTTIRTLAESYDWYFFPSVNPDGYVYTHTTYRLWRKTRSEHSLLCKGADANRNWEYQWMNGGASLNPCAETYAGSAAFSEIETKTLSQFITSISDKLFAYISFHSYSQLLLFPYGHTTAHLDNYAESKSMGLKAIAALAQRYGTEYETGNIAETIYVASGSSMDWVKATFQLPVTFTYELRDTGNYGFILPAEQIIPNGLEVLDSLLAMFTEATRLGYPESKK